MKPPVAAEPRPAPHLPSASVQLAWLSLAMFFGMTLWFSATAVNAAIVQEFQLTGAETAWLTMAVQAGFVIGTLIAAFLNLPDIISARRLFAVGCVLGAAANALVTVAGGTATIITLRLLTGAALAWVYPPGMKVATGWFDSGRGTALGVLIGALTVGSAFPHLLASMSAHVAWRALVLTASGLAGAGAAVIVTFVGDGPYVSRSARFEPRAAVRVFSNRPTRLATLAYLGHMWELYAVWTWIAAFAAASFGVGTGAARASAAGSALAFAAIGSGAIGSAAAGVYADRIGQARVAAWAMIVSGTCCVLAGFVFRAPQAVLFVFAIVWGVAVIADSAQLSALVARYSPRDHVGTALTIQTCTGFLLTMGSIRLLPIAAGVVGWQWVFLCLVPGPWLGAAALKGMRD